MLRRSNRLLVARIAGSGIWQAAEGSKSVDLDGAEDTAGAISQTFATVINATYFVTFSMSGNPGNPAVSPIKTMSVDAAGATHAYTHSTDTSGTTFADMKWATARPSRSSPRAPRPR